jgi:predicted aspartyl protease
VGNAVCYLFCVCVLSSNATASFKRPVRRIAASSTHLVEKRSSTPRPQQGGRPTNTVSEIPFKLSGGFLILVEGRIGTLGKLKFILDTGMTRSVVDRKVAERLRIPRYPRQMFDFDKVLHLEGAIFPEVQFGPVRVASVSMSVGNLVDLSTLAAHADAAIGTDLLGLNDITIDYGAKRVLFRPPERLVPDALVNAAPEGLTVEVEVQDHPIRLLVDTGFPDILLFEDRLRRDIPELRTEDMSDPFSIAGRLLAKRATLPKVQLGTRAASCRLLLADGPPSSVMPGVDGLLGTAALKARRVDINFVTKTFDWEK